MDLAPFLLTLVGGWLCGFAFVNFTLGMKHTGLGVVLHVAGAAGMGLLLHWMTFWGKGFLKELPEQASGLVFLFQMGSVPAAGWIWLGLLGRITFSASKPSEKAKAARIAPAWEDTSPGTQLQFSAVPMQTRNLTFVMVGVCLVGSGLAFWLLMSFDAFFLKLASPKLFVIVFGLLIGLPGYFIFKAIVGRKTIPCSIAFGNDRIRIAVGSENVTINYRDLDRLIWRCESDYARVEVHVHGRRISLLAGLARTPKTVLAQLPPLSKVTIRRLAGAGLEKQPTRRKDLSIFAAKSAKELSDSGVQTRGRS
ncbi:hypothetical protein [Arthrobacter sp. GMC3]|uniref:hypothetical protein n=1 Tax=Arthrobacter sp. GMC3 TaxID=2058894 RepID=UPI0011B07C42|nr:hypothetical protein [Arthrobacter sp. GMC3]